MSRDALACFGLRPLSILCEFPLQVVVGYLGPSEARHPLHCDTRPIRGRRAHNPHRWPASLFGRLLKLPSDSASDRFRESSSGAGSEMEQLKTMARQLVLQSREVLLVTDEGAAA